ncbi:histidine phosphatase family protein [Halomonas sp. V046]|uniref:histidine phosphatase family protein n=1 Tax=Halomonas sp. V046 TaxID=3459611 RepID=UPI00404515B5
MSNPRPFDFSRCHNHYLVMRHGHSQANAMGLIVSSPQEGLAGYGLSPKGHEQLARRLDEWHLAPPTHLLHSDFLRTTETAAHVAAHFGLTARAELRLRERFFGNFDLGPDHAYAAVWAEDASDASHQGGGVESVRAVAERLTRLIEDLENELDGATILLVGHGDPLQILLTAAAGRDLASHRDQIALVPADVKPLVTP